MASTLVARSFLGGEFAGGEVTGYRYCLPTFAGLDYFIEDYSLTCLLFENDLDHTGSYLELKR